MFRTALLRNDPESRVNRLHVPALSQEVRELEITTCDVQTGCKNGAALRALLDTLIKAARAVGKVMEIKISKTPRAVSAR